MGHNAAQLLPKKFPQYNRNKRQYPDFGNCKRHHQFADIKHILLVNFQILSRKRLGIIPFFIAYGAGFSWGIVHLVAAAAFGFCFGSDLWVFVVGNNIMIPRAGIWRGPFV